MSRITSAAVALYLGGGALCLSAPVLVLLHHVRAGLCVLAVGLAWCFAGHLVDGLGE